MPVLCHFIPPGSVPFRREMAHRWHKNPEGQIQTSVGTDTLSKWESLREQMGYWRTTGAAYGLYQLFLVLNLA